MSRHVFLFTLLFVGFNFHSAIVANQNGDVAGDLARAEALLNANQLQPAIDALLALETRVKDDPQRSADKLKINLSLGLAYLGLNQQERAKSRFLEVCTIDENYTLNPNLYAFRVISLFEEAKKSCTEKRCAEVCSAPDSRVAGSPGQVKAAAARCTCQESVADTQTVTPSAVQSAYRDGKALYDQGRYTDALAYFDVVLALDARHELAREYSNLARQQLQLGPQRAFTEWQASFTAREYDRAAAAYQRVKAAEQDPVARNTAAQIEAEYQKTFTEMLTSWTNACTERSEARQNAIRQQASQVASNLSFAQPLLRQLETCSRIGCIEQETALALTRVKTRVVPQFDRDLRAFLPRQVRVRISIDEQGNVTVQDMTLVTQRVSDTIKRAVEQWKFHPTIVDGKTQCSQTQLIFDFSRAE